MSRSVAAVSALLLAGSITPAAPRPKAGNALYFPTAVGDTAVYLITIEDLRMEGTYRVTAVQRTRDGFRVTVDRGSAGKPAALDQTDVSAEGLTLLQFGNRAIDPPTPVLRLPAKAGDTWEWAAPKADGVPARKTKFKVVGEEEVDVPAGKFKAIHVEQEVEANGRTVRYEEWYAAEVGLVKKVFHHLGATKQVQVLKSFTAGKD